MQKTKLIQQFNQMEDDGRMGREGTAYSFFTPDQGGELTSIEKLINVQLIRDDWSEIEAPPAAAAAAAAAPRPTSGLLGRSGRAQKKYRRGLRPRTNRS